jgi:polysaccharide export outer membrane protein
MLGPEDTVQIHVLHVEEIGAAPYAIDLRGNMNLPRVGKVHAAGLTLDLLEAELATRFKEFLQEPVVSVAVAEYHSQPISVLGAVSNPGVHQIRGRKTLFEVISEAGGLKPEAGNTIKITRRNACGLIPLPGVTADSSGQFNVASVSIRSVMEAQNPLEDIAVKPNDVITVPKADLIYVVGAVNRSGGFVLSEKSNMSVLEALSLAEGLQRTAGPSNAKILKAALGSSSRTEFAIDVKKIMEGKEADVPLGANDILFIPTSAAKSASLRALEAIVQTGTGIAIYGRY